jgi:hypothetical protein
MEIARARNHPYALANAMNAWGFLCRRQGIFAAAIPVLEEGLRLSRTLGFRSFVRTLGALLAEVLAETGRTGEAQALLDEDPQPSDSVHGFRPHTLLLVGQLHDARVLAGERLARHRERGERGAEAWMLWLLGELAARELPGETGATADRFHQALALADELGMRPLVAHCHLGLGKLSRRTGKPQEAQGLLTIATTMYHEMDMTYWLEQAKPEMRELAG